MAASASNTCLKSTLPVQSWSNASRYCSEGGRGHRHIIVSPTRVDIHRDTQARNTNTCKHKHIRTHTHTHTKVQIHRHLCTHTRTHTHTHTTERNWTCTQARAHKTTETFTEALSPELHNKPQQQGVTETTHHHPLLHVRTEHSHHTKHKQHAATGKMGECEEPCPRKCHKRFPVREAGWPYWPWTVAAAGQRG